jgi:hypothetical protein
MKHLLERDKEVRSIIESFLNKMAIDGNTFLITEVFLP